MTVFFFFLERSQFLKDEARTKKKKKLLDVFVVSHTLTWRSKFKESHWSVSDLTCQISWWGFSSTCFFFFFSGKNLSLFCVGGKHKQYIYIYIRYLSSVFLHSAVTLLFHFFPSSFNDTQSVCLSPSFFFRRNPLSLYQSPLLFFLFPPSLSSLTLCLPRIFFAMWARRLILLISPDSIIGCLPAQLSTAHII